MRAGAILLAGHAGPEEPAMNTTTPTDSSPAAHAPAPAAEAPMGVGDKAVVILFLIGVTLFGLISLVDLLSNLFR
jgi:hypothetical protein